MTALRTKPDTGTAVPLHTTFADLTRALAVPARSTVADAWRISQQEVREDIRFIGVYRKVLSEKGARLSTGRRVHSAAYVEACRVNLDTTCKRYLRRVRQISEAEAQMEAMGITFAKSSDAWDEFPAHSRAA